MSLQAVIDKARADIGYTESPPNSNKTKYGEWYSMNGQPWCVMALAYWFDQAGESMAFFGGGKTASCGTLLRWYQAQGMTVPVAEVKPGDIVILNFSGTKETQHCGYVTGVVRNKGKSNGYVMSVRTIEGNTSVSGSQSNGGMVCEKTRYPSQIVGVCRPEYTADPTEPDYEGHWAEEAIRKAIAKGVLKGYEDGSFRPDKPVTRAELATVLDRLGVLE